MGMFEVYAAETGNLATIENGALTTDRSLEFHVTIKGTESGAEHSLTWTCGEYYPLTTDKQLRQDIIEAVALDIDLATEGFTTQPVMRELIGRLVDEIGLPGAEAYDTAKALTGECDWFAQLTRVEREALEQLARELAG